MALNWIQRFLTAITTHKGDASAHHTKTTNASELTSGVLPSINRLPALASGKIWAGNVSNRPVEEDKPVALEGEKLTVAGWQAITATGTAISPTKINDGDTGTFAEFDAVNEYVELDFSVPIVLTQYRHYGNASHVPDGYWKIEYWDMGAQAWADWVTGISTRKDSWSDWITVSTIRTTKLRIVCTTKDTGPAGVKSLSAEFELKY